MSDRRKILIMDDELLIRETAKEMLEITGFDVDVASDGQEAIQKYKTALNDGNPFHAVILDMIVPGGLGGRETVKELLNIDDRVKVVISSGSSCDEIMKNYKNYGFSASIHKPYKINELHELMETLVI